MEKSTQIFTIIKYQKKAFNCKKDKNYYPREFSEEYKYVIKKKKPMFITNDKEISSDDSDKDSDERNSNEEN